ncbi:MAG TPA: alpha/beta hydrolase [Steroidobacteraceae bacterium]|jgi:proline iminopeptidase|nr:alpha/beta hydrolase [Steroidobacteraceae bacterium]
MQRLALIGLLLLFGAAAVTRAQDVTEGFVTADDGVQLYYVKAGHGAQTVILPARLFTFEDFRWLAERYTLIAYDMRNRGKSSRVDDLAKISIQADVADLETIRRHFGVEKFHTIGYSYLGLMVVLYALDHPERVERLVQLGPVPLKFGSEYRPEYVAADRQQVIDQHGGARLRELRERNFHSTHPREYCEEEWRVVRFMLIGDTKSVDRLGPGLCDLPNEWPTNLARHLEQHFGGSIRTLDVPRERVAKLQTPVLTIHGTRDRNAPYGAGREWVYLLPNARLVPLQGAAHQSFAERPEEVRSAVSAFLGGGWPAGAEQVTEDPRRL